MMISPETYYELHLKGKSANEIRSAIRGLKQSIGRNKSKLENPSLNEVELCFCPSPETQIACEREYLLTAIIALEKLGEKYVPSIREQKAIEFDANIENIKEIIFDFGRFGTIRNIIVRFEGDQLKYSDGIYMIEEMELPYYLEKDEFIELFRDIYIGEWKRHYPGEKYRLYVLDGTEWQLTIKYADGTRDRVFSGNNCYPYNFSKLLSLLGIEQEFEDFVAGEED